VKAHYPTVEWKNFGKR